VSLDQRVDQPLSEGVHLHLDLRLRSYAEESLLICERRYIELASFTAALRIQNSIHAKNLRQYPSPFVDTQPEAPDPGPAPPRHPDALPSHTAPSGPSPETRLFLSPTGPQVTLLCLFDLRMSAVIAADITASIATKITA